MRRSETRDEARKLRDQGLTYVEIADRLGAGKSTIRRWCDEFANEKHKRKESERRASDPEYRKQKCSEWYSKNLSRKSQYDKVRRNCTEFRQRQRDRLRNEPGYRETRNLRYLVWRSYKGLTKPESSFNLLGCTLQEFQTHLESLFQPGMTHENYGEWHIDHIRPLVSFDLTQEDQRRASCHYTNLQPLWAKDNLSKGAKYDLSL
jgi:IS30 family transposase